MANCIWLVIWAIGGVGLTYSLSTWVSPHYDFKQWHRNVILVFAGPLVWLVYVSGLIWVWLEK